MAARPEDEMINPDAIARANTLPMLVFGMPWPWMIVTVLGPPILMILTSRPSVLLLWPLLMMAGRGMVAGDVHRPRIWWLWIMSGAAFADRHSLGGDSPPALPRRDPWFGNYHG